MGVLSCAKSVAKGKRRILSKRRMDILMVSIYIIIVVTILVIAYQNYRSNKNIIQ